MMFNLSTENKKHKKDLYQKIEKNIFIEKNANHVIFN